MAFSQAQLDAIEAGIAAGTTSISYDGRSVTYRSLDEMIRIRALLRTALGITAAPVTVLVEHGRGYRDVVGGDDI